MTVLVNFGYLIALKECGGVVIKRPAERDVRFKSIFTNEKKHTVIQQLNPLGHPICTVLSALLHPKEQSAIFCELASP